VEISEHDGSESCRFYFLGMIFSEYLFFFRWVFRLEVVPTRTGAYQSASS
jgi:hypothetical protein